jgi:hypothetical protein
MGMEEGVGGGMGFKLRYILIRITSKSASNMGKVLNYKKNGTALSPLMLWS